MEEAFDYESYCGLYCGACDILTAYKNGLEQQRPPQWNDLPAPIRRNIPAAPIRCHGCKTETVFQGCAKCPIRKCAKKQTGIESCLDCRKYPCMLHKIAKIVIAVQRLEKKLPHLKCKPGNLAVIKEKGMQTWLQEQQRLWECPECHASFSWYQTECAKCGKRLDEYKDFL